MMGVWVTMSTGGVGSSGSPLDGSTPAKGSVPSGRRATDPLDGLEGAEIPWNQACVWEAEVESKTWIPLGKVASVMAAELPPAIGGWGTANPGANLIQFGTK